MQTYDVLWRFKDDRQPYSTRVSADGPAAAADQVQERNWTPRHNGDACDILRVTPLPQQPQNP
ncbi:hypothetical protein [Streptomyces sp. CC224B]|uniref:hypothetical protein n=1 Tax=Streptomyces sp. CC224B TaxID=3044571 RepID=UPI0024A99D43|nr:hypothetical protein [Streptomyces sp. CC224B]